MKHARLAGLGCLMLCIALVLGRVTPVRSSDLLDLGRQQEIGCEISIAPSSPKEDEVVSITVSTTVSGCAPNHLTHSIEDNVIILVAQHGA